MIRSVAFAVDGAARAKFDAVGFFASATEREILILAIALWQGAAAIQAAYGMLDGSGPEFYVGLRSVIAYVRDHPDISFQVVIHGPDALRWITEHRLDVAGSIEDVLGPGASEVAACDPGPAWDRVPGWVGDYEGGMEADRPGRSRRGPALA